MPRINRSPRLTDRSEKTVFRLVGGRVTTSPRPPARATALVPVPAESRSPTATEDQIRVLAYQKWEAAGSPPGDGVQFWLEAEHELATR